MVLKANTWLLIIAPIAGAALAAMLPAATGVGHAQGSVAPPARVESSPLPPPPGAPPAVASPAPPLAPAPDPQPQATTSPPAPPPAGTPLAGTPPLQPPPVASAPVDPALPPIPRPPIALPTPEIQQPGGQLAPSIAVAPRDLSNEPDLAELVIEPRPVLVLAGESSNDEAFANLQNAMFRLNEEARKAGIIITGRPFAVIDLTDEKRFKFEAMLPIENTAQTPPVPGLRFGQSPSGQAVRFKYSGAYEDDSYVYESIEAYIEERDIKARPYAIEEFLTDPKDAADASLQMFIYYLKD